MLLIKLEGIERRENGYVERGEKPREIWERIEKRDEREGERSGFLFIGLWTTQITQN
jgi:hypothetical protein